MANCKERVLRRAILASVTFVVVSSFVVWSIQALRESQRIKRRSLCVHRLLTINLLLHTYHAKYGHFPPAVVRDVKGNPLYSWRLLILGTSGIDKYVKIYKSFDHTEPWNSKRNLAILDCMPEFYACPSAEFNNKTVTGHSNYVAIVGPSTVFPNNDWVSIGDIQDELQNTLLITETTPGVPWTAPSDLDIGDISVKTKAGKQHTISSEEWECANALMANSTVIKICNTLTQEEMIELVTIKKTDITKGHKK